MKMITRASKRFKNDSIPIKFDDRMPRKQIKLRQIWALLSHWIALYKRYNIIALEEKEKENEK